MFLNDDNTLFMRILSPFINEMKMFESVQIKYMCIVFIWLDAYLRKCLFQFFRNDIEKGFSFEKGMIMGEGSGESLF